MNTKRNPRSKNTKYVGTRLEEPLYDELTQTAVKMNMTRSYVIREACIRYLNELKDRQAKHMA